CFGPKGWSERELRLQSRDKVRVYILARELDIDTADLLRMCQQAGFDVKNQLSNLDPDQQKHLEEIVKNGAKAPAAPAPAKPVTKVVAPEAKAVPVLSVPRAPKREPEPHYAPPEPVEVAPPMVAEAPAPVAVAATLEATPAAVPVTPGKSAAPQLKDRMPTLGSKPNPVAAKAPMPAPAPAPLVTAARTDSAPAVKPEAPKAEPPRAPATTTTPSRATTNPAIPRHPKELGTRPTTARDPGSSRPGGVPPRRSDQPLRRPPPAPSHMAH